MSQYQQYGGNPYNGAPGADAGYSPQQGHLAQPGLQHETSNYSGASEYSQPAPPAHTSSVLSQQDFLNRCQHAKDEIRSLSSNIQEISSLHQRSLSSADSSSSAQLEGLVTQTQLKNTQIRDQIKYLELDAVKTSDTSKSIKNLQAKQLKETFQRALQDYQQEELSFRTRYREQIARQFRIVNPDATEDEVKQASEMDWGSEGVFQTALKSNRTGQASSVLGAVRARHNELQRIEATLTDLGEMFQEMAQMVEAQDPVIEHTEQNAQKTNDDMEGANTQIEVANKHARRRRRNKWWCLLVVVLIILAIALGVGLGVYFTNKKP